MRCSNVQQWLGRLLVVSVFVVLGLPVASFGKEAAGGAPLGMADIVKQATQQSAAGHRIEKLANGHARVPSPVQAIEAVAAPEGVTVTSTKKDQPGSFAIRAASLGRIGSSSAPVAPGAVSLDKDLARIVHPGLTEELTTSAEGIQQDFLVPAAPQGKGELVLELSFSGAALHKSGEEVELSMPEGRKFLYRRLHVTDSRGTSLPARFEVQGADRLRIVVADAGAAYPVRIDPTITDANWVSIELPSTNGDVYALLYAGGNLYAGGDFTVIGGTVANSVAKWDGSSWSAVGSGMDGGVGALDWDGVNLYAGGWFTTAGGNSANNIAKWDGNSWSALGSGMNDFVRALVWDGANLYAGGGFTTAGGAGANYIAKWNGSSWSPLGSGVDNADYFRGVYALAWDGANLYAGGAFTTAGGAGAKYIAKWNGSSWSSLGSGFDYHVYALLWDGANLYAGGLFNKAGGSSANYIARWDGSSWSPVGSGMNSTVFSLVWDGANLYAGGYFSTAGGTGANYIAKWDGVSWSPVGSGMNGGVLAWDGANLYAGGNNATAGPAGVNNVAKWDGSSWSALDGGMNYAVYALVSDGTNLYAGGFFTSAGGNSANYIAKWDGSSWSPLGSGMNDSVYALAWDGVNLYAGGMFTTAGGTGANYIAKWNGSSWSPMASGVNGTVYALAWDGANLYAGGQYYYEDFWWPGYVAKWNGSSWSALGSGMNDFVCALVWDGANLYAGGGFTTAGGNSANNIAKWNGNSWSPMASGVNGIVYALAWDGVNLYAGGYFTGAGGRSAKHIARWNGSSWLALGGGMDYAEYPEDTAVYALVWDGANLYAGGYFTTAGGTGANNIAKWNGSFWSALGSGMNYDVKALAWDGTNLYAGGYFTTAGGESARVAYLSTTVWGVKPKSANASYTGGEGAITFTVAGKVPSAELQASSSASWLTITSPSSVPLKHGRGSGKVTWSAEPNPASTSRSATIAIGSQTVTITQSAAPCVVKLTPTKISEEDNFGGAATITVTAPDACGWEVSPETATWINPTPSSGTGAGIISLDISANTTGKSRRGKVTVATEAKSASVTVKQPK